MSPWTTLLESFHSSLIDELIERHPEPKPELGLPTRKPKFELPETGLASVICATADFGSSPTGCVALCLSAGAAKKLKLQSSELWAAVGKRAVVEFGHRGIQPRLGQATPLGAGGTLPAGFSEPQRMVWIPFRIGGDVIYLGMGV